MNMALTHTPNKIAVEDDADSGNRTDLLSVEQVARRLNVSAQTVRTLTRTGGLRTVRVGTKMRFRPQWVEDYIERRAR
jgi:excisionase family DNA binding protein